MSLVRLSSRSVNVALSIKHVGYDTFDVLTPARRVYVRNDHLEAGMDLMFFALTVVLRGLPLCIAHSDATCSGDGSVRDEGAPFLDAPSST